MTLVRSANDHLDTGDLKTLLMQALACADALDLPIVGIKISEAIDALVFPEVDSINNSSIHH